MPKEVPLIPKEDPLGLTEGHQQAPQTDRRLSQVDKGYSQANTRPHFKHQTPKTEKEAS